MIRVANLLLLLTLAGPLSGHATSSAICNSLLDGTIYDHVDAAKAEIAAAYKRRPAPQFGELAREARTERAPIKGPAAFNDMLPQGSGFLATPDPNTEHPVMAARMEPGQAGMLRLAVPFKGQTLTTFVYVNIPGIENQPVGSKYLVNPPVKKMVFHIHGGGTPSAVAMNASSLAQDLAKEGIATVAVTQVGHGDATRKGIESMEDLVDFNLQVLKMLVHPDVVKGITGHSWGAMIALYMHQRSDQPKYGDISFFGIHSPAIDATLGGSLAERMKADAELERKFVRLALGEEADTEGLLARACKDDIDFQANCALNGKLNPIGTWFTTLTDLSYSMAIPSPEKVRQLKPACFSAGMNDTLCVVGKEKPMIQYAEAVFGKENVFLFGEGQTWRGKTDKTGHQTMENELILPDGTKVLELFHRMMRFIERVTGPNEKPAPGRPDNSPNNKVEDGKRLELKSRAVHGALVSAYLLYQNNWAFRSYLNNSESYIRKETSPKMEAELIALKARKAELEKAVLQYRQAEALTSDEAIQKGLAEFVRKLNQDHGILVRSTFSGNALTGGKQSAELELSLKLSARRKAELETYIERSHKFVQGFVSPETIRVFQNDVDGLLASIKVGKGTNLEEAKRIALRYFWLQQPETEREMLRQRWPRLGFGDELATEEWKKATDKKILNKRALSKEDAATYTTAATIDQNLKDLWKKYKRLNSEAIDQGLKSIPLPEGIVDTRSANWELRLYGMTDAQLAARREALADYVKKFDERLAAERVRLQKEAEAKLINFVWPAGAPVRSLEQAISQINLVADIESDLYVPPGASSKVRKVVEEIQRLKNRLEEVTRDEDVAYKELTSLLKRRAEVVSELSRHMPFEDSLTTESKTKFSGRPAEQATRQFWDAFKWMADASEKLSRLQSEYLLSIHKDGRVTEAQLRRLPQHIKTAEGVFASAKEQFLMARATYRRFQIVAGLSGQAASPTDPNGQQIKALLGELLGNSLLRGNETEIDEHSLEGRIVKAREQEKGLLKEKIGVKNQLDREQVNFTKLTPAEGRYFTTRAIRWSDVFNKSWADLERWFVEDPDGDLRLEAFRRFMKTFEREWVRSVKAEHNYVAMPWYQVRPEGRAKVVITIK
jgi:pimeloyl-ACP methyl ester carboxylesterase